MEENERKFTDAAGASRIITGQGGMFAVVDNLPYVFPAQDVYVLAAPHTQLEDGLDAVVMDMDGTTTTTEVLCTGALESMVRRMRGLDAQPDAPVIDRERDYPHIIGNSTTKHVQYLIGRYGDAFDAAASCRHFIESCAWTLSNALDARRTHEAANALRVQGLTAVLDDVAFRERCARLKAGAPYDDRAVAQLAREYAPLLRLQRTEDLTRIGIEIYYQRYHESLKAIARGDALKIPGQARPIEPMPGIGVALALLKGWLGSDAARFADILAAYRRDGDGNDSTATAAERERLTRLGALVRRSSRQTRAGNVVHRRRGGDCA
jgi:phosphoglycolate phosphatase-like HAD superfamily hydrolase